ncbi:MAG: IS3 family transposase [Gallionella sp.]
MRRSSVAVAQRNEVIVEQIRSLKSFHPFWGYRRVWAHLRYVDGRDVNKKRILRLMRQHKLLVQPNLSLKATRTPGRSKPKPNRPNQWWGIDMTKVMTVSGWAYLVIVLDWYTKQIVGHHCGRTAISSEWLSALDRGLNRQFPDGVREHDLHLMSDNGSQPTSIRFMKACGVLGVHQAFTSYNNPKGNADTERMMRTLKEELIWLREWPSVNEITAELDKWIASYNETYLHSALGYRTPNQAEKAYNLSHRTLLETAC